MCLVFIIFLKIFSKQTNQNDTNFLSFHWRLKWEMNHLVIIFGWIQVVIKNVNDMMIDIYRLIDSLKYMQILKRKG